MKATLSSAQDSQGLECGRAHRLVTELGAGGLSLYLEACDALRSLEKRSGRHWYWGEVSADHGLVLPMSPNSLDQHVLKLRVDGLLSSKYSLTSLRG